VIDPVDLPWLLPAPTDFRSRMKALKDAPEPRLHDLRALAGFACDLSQLGGITRLVEKRNPSLASLGTLRPVKLAVAASHTSDFIEQALPATGLRHGLLVDTIKIDYGQGPQQLLDPSSAMFAAKPDFVLIAFDPLALGLGHPVFSDTAAVDAVENALGLIRALVEMVRTQPGVTAIVQTLVPPIESTFGSFDARAKGSVRWMIDRFNTRLAGEVLDDADLLFDAAALATTIGLARWHDPMRWHDAKMPCALAIVPLFAEHLCRVLAAARGLSRKALVLDLDNTLWGGVIGDDGLEGIKLGQGSAAGEAHLTIQSYALSLRDRGILLAVCSKNEEAAALLPFREHPEMLIKEDHISVFVANWTDKASNLKFIAETLNIGTDALVFLDDNPAERERVRQELPEVAVPEVGSEPADYAPILSMAGYFEAISFGDEDRTRAEMYQANAMRTSQMQKIGNMDDYLRSLEMVCTIQPFDALGRARISQLINKSNQFNLTTRRYSEAEVAVMESDPAKFTMQVRLVDRFGDNGMISVVVFDRDRDEWHCDTWLMSCRVLGRRVEEAVLAEAAAAARAAGAVRLIGDYLPTPKNVLVEKHFEKLGFRLIEELGGGGTRWALELADYKAPDLPMVIESATDLLLDSKANLAPALQHQ